MRKKLSPETNHIQPNSPRSERGAALATSLVILALLGVVSMTVLAVVTHESRIAGSDLQRTQTFYAAATGVEKMTNGFSALFNRTSRPTTTDLNNIAAAYPTELTSEGFGFSQSLVLDSATLGQMGSNPTVTIPNGPFSGLIASVTPYLVTSTATMTNTGTQVSLQRKINNYLVPIFQFGMFSNEDLEIHPGPPFAFNGRVHANGNLYISGTTTFLSKVTTANEIVTDVLRNGSTHDQAMFVQVGSINVALTKGSMNNGPNISGTSTGQRGYFPGSPAGSFNSSWDLNSVAAAQTNVANKFGGQLITRTTGGATLRLPLELDGFSARELIKRKMPNDTQTLSDSRYHTKAVIRILLDDETPAATDVAGIPAGQGVALSTWDPIPLPGATPSSTPTVNGGGRALWRINDNNTSFNNSYNETSTTFIQQQQNGTARQADTVRGVKGPAATKNITGATNANPIVITCTNHGYSTGDIVFISGVAGNTNANGEYTITKVNANSFQLNGRSGNAAYTANTGVVYPLKKSPNGTIIPAGSGINGRILIQIVDAAGNSFDVTQQILSMGITEGEPNAVVMLQRPLWAAFAQGTRDASGSTNPILNGDPVYANTLADMLTNTHVAFDGEIKHDSTNGYPTQDTTYGYLTKLVDDTPAGSQMTRSDVTPSNALALLLSDWGAGSSPTAAWYTDKAWNSIVPINVYNVREGYINSASASNEVYERGITSVVELNMRNLARWMDGVYDNNLLAGTSAVSTNIGRPDGYTVYVSDRRGDRVKAIVDLSGANVNSSNGMADNEDIYGPNGTLDPGEDVQATGALVKDTAELPDPALLAGTSGADFAARVKRAISVAAWTNSSNYFRRSVRVFNGENLQVPGAVNQNLSDTSGITISSENMVYIWGNYNTTGINSAPPNGVAALNDPSATYHYNGSQVPASIVSDAFFPLSKTFFDATTAIYPDDVSKRRGDAVLPGVAAETSIRAGIIAGNNLSALSGSPDQGNSSAGESRLSGGMHNFPRFLENWSGRCNFVGSFIPLFHSTQALGPYNANSTIYGAPVRDWAFDDTFKDPTKLPPGTPLFQYIEPTGFKQVL